MPRSLAIPAFDKRFNAVLAIFERKPLDELRRSAVGEEELLALEQLAGGIPDLDLHLCQRGPIFAELPAKLARLRKPSALPKPRSAGDQRDQKQAGEQLAPERAARIIALALEARGLLLLGALAASDAEIGDR